MEYSLEDDVPEEFKKSTLAINSDAQKSGNTTARIAIMETIHSTPVAVDTTSDKKPNNSCTEGIKLISVPQCSKWILIHRQ